MRRLLVTSNIWIYFSKEYLKHLTERCILNCVEQSLKDLCYYVAGISYISKQENIKIEEVLWLEANTAGNKQI